MIYIFGGGTFSFIRNHLALCAPAFGTTARTLKTFLPNATLVLTKMADHTSSLVSNNDIANFIKDLLLDKRTKCIILNSALCDFDGQIGDIQSGSHAQRLETREGLNIINITPSPKLISNIKNIRPDIFVVGFKTTTNADKDIMIFKSRRMGIDLVLANDTVTRRNIIVTSSNSFEMSSRREALLKLVSLL